MVIPFHPAWQAARLGHEVKLIDEVFFSCRPSRIQARHQLEPRWKTPLADLIEAKATNQGSRLLGLAGDLFFVSNKLNLFQTIRYAGDAFVYAYTYLASCRVRGLVIRNNFVSRFGLQ